MTVDVAWLHLPDDRIAALVHRGGKFRQVVLNGMDEAERMLASVLVAEFGVEQEEARAHAAKAVAAPQMPAPPALDDAEHVQLLQDQLTDTQGELAEAQREIASLKEQLAAATAPAVTEEIAPQTATDGAAGATDSAPAAERPTEGDGG